MHQLQFIRQNTQVFAQRGSVVATYRTRGDRRYGPYFRVAYRVAGRQCSLYLGRCNGLADHARALLAKLQQPRNLQRKLKRARRQQRATFRRVIRQWQQTIRAYGLDLRGCEIRGWRALGIPRSDKTTPLTPTQKAAAAFLFQPPPSPPGNSDTGRTDDVLTNNVGWLSRADQKNRQKAQQSKAKPTTGRRSYRPISAESTTC